MESLWHQAYQSYHYKIPKGEEREKGEEIIFDEIMAKHF